jgi:hypothetical protein
MKRFKDGLVTVVAVVGLMGFLGYNVLAPVNAGAEEKKVAKEEKAAKDTKAAKETKAAPAPAKKKAVKRGAASVSVSPQLSEIFPKAKIDIMGAGFIPDEEVRILYTDAEGMQTDIGYALEPAPKAGKSGAWLTTWDCEEFIKAKLVTDGAFELVVTDNEFKPIAKTYVYFKKAAKKADAPKGDKKEGDKKEKKEGDKKEGDKGEKKAETK